MPKQPRSKSKGFTLIEVLVAITIIAVLMALLVPAISRVRYQANVTHCASNIRQICLAMNNYAISNDGQFPDDDIPQGTGADLWDTSIFFVNALNAQGVKQETYICPLEPTDSYTMSLYNYFGYFYILQYNIWIPRLNGPYTIPPSPTAPGPYLLSSPPPAAPFAGPAKLSDLVAQNNPIVTDFVGSYGATPPGRPNLVQTGNPYELIMYHTDNGRFMGTNQGFADGHVEVHGPESLQPYYKCAWWNWR